MKKLITICAVVGLILVQTCVSWAGPTVTPPRQVAPVGGTQSAVYYAYGYWEEDIPLSSGWVSPPDDAAHWASNFLNNTDFTAGIFGMQARINLKNEYRADYYKEIYIYIEGTTTNLVNAPIEVKFDPKEGTFTGSRGGINLGDGTWRYIVSGEIIPQPSSVLLFVDVPGLTSVTNIWAGENCIPEPVTFALLGLGGLFLRRRK